jgi:hypothetical protein
MHELQRAETKGQRWVHRDSWTVSDEANLCFSMVAQGRNYSGAGSTFFNLPQAI